MAYRAVLLLLGVPSVGIAGPYAMTADFYPRPLPPGGHVFPLADPVAGVEQVGDVVILEGDTDLVMPTMGGFGIFSAAGQQLLITDRFFSAYPDEFDEIIVFTTFDDAGAANASAYEISARQDVMGIG